MSARRTGERLFGVLVLLRRRALVTLALGVAVEVAAMLVVSMLARIPQGTPGALGVSIAVLAAIASGPAVGVLVGTAGWLAFFVLVAERDPMALIALPVWLGCAYAVGLVTLTLVDTESRRAAAERDREELRRLEQLKGRFAALAAHELRTPAAAIYGVVRTLAERGERLAADERRTLERMLYAETERLTRLIEQLLDLSRLEAGAVPIEPRPLRLAALAREAAAAAGPSGGDVTVLIDPELEVVADPQALERILTNLVGNALRHAAPPVSVSAEQRDRHLRVRVEDNGPGIAADFVPELFGAFSRDRRAGVAGPGTGLGLSIARAYARAHGGDLIYEPAEAAGSRFELVLPQQPPASPDAR